MTATTTGTAAALARHMERYTVGRLAGIDADAFRAGIDGFLGLRDHAMEGYGDPSRQRDLSIRFHWGHDHDFGAFALPGRMGARHLEIPARFIDELDALPADLSGARVLDIGCWTGGMSLLLVAMGAEVVAIDEVRKYVECVEFLARSFGVADRLRAEARSLYDLDGDRWQDAFDFVILSGVIYHVSDPVIALRRVFNCLRNGGTCLLETFASPRPGRLLEYAGPTSLGPGRAEDLDRSGWNWFVPTAGALAQMLEDVGFGDVRLGSLQGRRLVASARRATHVDVLRAGLSVPEIR